MSYIIMAIVLLHIVAGFGYFIWKLEFQGRKKKGEEEKNSDLLKTENKEHSSK